MIVGPNWKPHVYTDAELDEIEKRGNGDMEEFGAVLGRCLSRMSEQEKRELRESWLAHCDRSSLRLTGADVRFLRENKIDPNGD